MNIVIDRELELKNNAAFKARVDVINVLRKHKYKYEWIPCKGKENKVRFLLKLASKLVTINFEYYSNIVIQYPINNYMLDMLILKAKRKKCKTVCIIHDIDSLRDNLDRGYIEREINNFNKFNIVVSHNLEMTKWLIGNGVKSKIYEMEIFDYLSNESVNIREKKEYYTVAYATGMLGTEKSKFLYKLNEVANNNIRFKLYGNILDELNDNISKSDKIIYGGVLDPNLIIKKIEGDFGLIWDSEELDGCIGNWGNYTKYNNPHKFSMYIAAGIPVIAWKESAISSYIIENNIGICVDSIKDLNLKLSGITSDEYNSMIKNVREVSERVRSGSYLEDVIRKIENN